MLRYLSILLVCGALSVHAQNLVTNPGFEEKYRCPTGRSEIIYLPVYRDFPTALDWVSPMNTTPDYFNTCATNVQVRVPELSLDGYHKPHGGEAYAGISMFAGSVFHDSADYWAEYLETKLSAPLLAGHAYYISYYVCLTNHAREAYNIISVDNIGARLTVNMLDTNCQGPMFYVNGPPDIHTPPGLFVTDTANWTLVSGVYNATGGEQWLTIGRFYSDVINYQLLYSPVNDITRIHSICYMLVDDVCVTDMANPEITDTNIYTPQFPIAIGGGKPEGQYLWYNGDTSLQITVQGVGTYTRQRWSGCSYAIDTFKVKEMPVQDCVWLPNAFTPNGDGLNDLFGPGNNYCFPDIKDFSFSIYNRWGQLVFQTVSPGEKWNGMLDGKPQEMGVYYYTLRYSYNGAFAGLNSSPGAETNVNGNVTLVR